MKSLYWETPKKLAFRFNLKIFLENIEVIGSALPKNSISTKKTLFLRGSKSDYIKDTDIEMIKNHFPNSEVQTIDNAGHWLHAENPKAFFKTVIDFLKK